MQIKKLLSAIILVLITTGASAQSKLPDPETVSVTEAQSMKDSLGLSEQQYKKLVKIHKTFFTEMNKLAALRDSSVNEKRLAVILFHQNSIAGVLTPEQLLTYQSAMSRRKQEAMQRMKSKQKNN